MNAPTPSDNIVFLAMVPLSVSRLPALRLLKSELGGFWSKKPKFKAFNHDGNVISAEIGAGAAAVALVEAPIPVHEIEAACELSPHWVDGAKVLRTHAAHLICTVAGPFTQRKEAAFHLTRLLSAVLQDDACIGVYWGAADMVHERAAFLAEAESMTPDLLPLRLWIRFVWSLQEGKPSVRTYGLSSLGFMEAEALQMGRSPEEADGLMFNFAHYLLDHGPIVKDGSTFGMSAEQKIQVRHVASAFVGDEKVYRLEL